MDALKKLWRIMLNFFIRKKKNEKKEPQTNNEQRCEVISCEVLFVEELEN